MAVRWRRSGEMGPGMPTWMRTPLRRDMDRVDFNHETRAFVLQQNCVIRASSRPDICAVVIWRTEESR